MTSDTAPVDNTRLVWLDYSRGFSIILVANFHVIEGLEKADLLGAGSTVMRVSSYFDSWSMALFFYMSGMFMTRAMQQRPRVFAAEKLRSFVYPYVLWVLLFSALHMLAGGATNDDVELGDLWRAIYDPPFHYWFLYVMLLGHILAYVLHRLRVDPRLMLALAFGASLTHTHVQLYPDWGPLYQLRQYFVFLALGAVMGRTGPILKLSHAPSRVIGSIVVVGLVLLPIVDEAGFRDEPSLYFIQAWIGGLTFVSLSILLHRRGRGRAIAVVGRYSLEIYLAHVFFTASTRIALDRLGVGSEVLHFAAGLTAGVVGPVLLAFAAQRLGLSWVFRLPRPESATRPTSSTPSAHPTRIPADPV